MKGFSNQFKNLPDYILKITKEIWEDRAFLPYIITTHLIFPYAFPRALRVATKA